MRYHSAVVTGAAGFIGSHLVERLAREGLKKIIAMDNLSAGSFDNLTSVKSSGNVEIVKADVMDSARVKRLFDGVEVVFHLAAIVGVELVRKMPLETLDTSILGTKNVLEACVESGAERLVYASSSEVYGESDAIPMAETLRLSPTSPYGLGKVVGEAYCKQYHRVFGLETAAVRYFNVYGPRQRSTDSGAVVPSFVTAALANKPMVIHGRGVQTRDFTYVDDAVEATLLAAYKGDGNGSLYNVGTGRETSVKELGAMVRRLIGSKGGTRHTRPRPADVGRRCADISRAALALGYKPSVTLEEGLKPTCDYYRKFVRSQPNAE